MLDEQIDPMSPGVGENVRYKRPPTKAKLTFFYEKEDGSVFAAEEQEAATMKYNRKFRLVGWSDGITYQKTIQEKKLKLGQVIPKEQAEQILRDAFEAELKVAKKNLANAKRKGYKALTPQRIEWYFDSSVPENERVSISKGKYGQASTGKEA